MHDAQQTLKVGRDPRMLPEYEKLRTEINKLSHASRPQVDWNLIHAMSLQIFEKQGVDLQTASYFTLARSRLHGLVGFTEGCEFLANLIVTQWENVWPPQHQERARIEMLDWFIARISDVIRQYNISHDDKRLIYRCERALQLISEKLHGVGLSRVPRVENLIHFVEGYTHLFDETEMVIVSDRQEQHTQDMQIPPLVYFRPDSAGEDDARQAPTPQGSIIVGREKGKAGPTVLKIEPQKKTKPGWFWFVSGLLTCALPVALFTGWHYWYSVKATQQSEALALLVKPAQALPGALSASQLREIRIALGEQKLREMESQVTGEYQAQLTRLQQASPLWIWHYADGLRHSLRILYPDSLAVSAMDNQWQQGMLVQRGANRSATAWLAAERRVENLLSELLDLERRHKTVTLSYLKSAVYDIRKDMQDDTPLSVRLQRLEAQQAVSQTISAGELNTIQEELKELTVRLYALLQQRKEQ